MNTPWENVRATSIRECRLKAMRNEDRERCGGRIRVVQTVKRYSPKLAEI